MKFHHLILITASLLLATWDAAAQVPDNASATDYYDAVGWECNRGYRKVGNSCIARCERKPSTCLRTFIKKKDYVSASNLYNENQELFLTAREKRRRAKQLQELADFLNSSFAPKVASLQDRIGSLKFDALDPSGWKSVASTMSAVHDLLEEHDEHGILKENEYRLPSVATLTANLNAEQERINGQVHIAFIAYDHAKGSGFFDVYPAVSEGGNIRQLIVRAAWPKLQPIMLSMTKTELLHLIDAWTSGKPNSFGSIFGANIRDSIANLYYGKVINQVLSQQEVRYEGFAGSILAATSVNLLPTEVISSRLLLILLDIPGDFEVSFDFDHASPFTVVRELPDSSIANSYDVILLVGVTRKEINERTEDTKTIRSKYHEGVETGVNPAYISAQSAYNAAINSYNIAESNFARIAADYDSCTANNQVCVVTSYYYGVAQRQRTTALENVAAARRRLNNTNSSITNPVYKNYNFAVSTIQLEKKIGGVVAMITSTANNAMLAPFSIENKQEVNVGVGTNPKDAGTAKRYETAEDLKRKESKGVSLPVIASLANLNGLDATGQPIADISQFLASITKPERPTQSMVSVSLPQNGLVAALSSHPAIGGVAVVRTPLGNLGTGFFVAKYYLLTNYHVIEDSDYVEIELFDGRSTTGRVLNFDIDRDLALIRTSIPGQPLELFSGNVLPLGESVTAIGHPGGLNFTITKGIISAVREQQSTSSLGLGASYLFVQTDTAISPGNSGGPLLLDNKVIGINTQKLVDVKVEGIGFALHYTEIARYLAVSMSN